MYNEYQPTQIEKQGNTITRYDNYYGVWRLTVKSKLIQEMEAMGIERKKDQNRIFQTIREQGKFSFGGDESVGIPPLSVIYYKNRYYANLG